MDKNQYGESPAAVNLVKILSRPENTQFNKRLSNLLTRYNHILNQLDTAGKQLDDTSRTKLLYLLRDDFKRAIPTLKFPPVVESHATNVFMRNWKLARENVDGRNDFLRQKIKKP